MDKKINENMDKHVAKYQELVGKRKTLQERLDRINAEKGSVKDTIYEKVRGEYEKQLGDLEGELKPMQAEIQKTRRMVEDELGKIEQEVSALEDELQEFSLRHRVGEFDDKELSKLKDPVQEKAGKLSKRKENLAQAQERLAGSEGPMAAEKTESFKESDEATPNRGRAGRKTAKTPSAKTDPAVETPEVPQASPDSKTKPETAPEDPDKSPVPETAPVAEDSPPAEPEPAREDAGADDPPPHDAPNPDEELIISGAKPSGPVDKMAGLVDTSEWSREFQNDGDQNGKGRRHTDKAATTATATDDDPLAALDEVSPDEESGGPTTGKTKSKATKKEKPMGFPVLIITKGPGAGKKLPLVPMTMTVGREHDNNIELKDEEVSRYHARISYESGQYVIMDLDSSSGTWVNNEKISEVTLNHGDKIRVGTTEMVIDFE